MTREGVVIDSESMTQGDRSELFGRLVDVVEDWLEAKGFTPEDFPNDDRNGDDDCAIIFGSDFDVLANGFSLSLGISRYCEGSEDKLQ